MMFYTMVCGWMMYYAYLMITGQMVGLSADGVVSVFNHMLASPGTMIFWMVLATLLSFGCVALGLKNGVEKITKVMMILLLLMMIVLAINSIRLNNASAGLRFYLIPNLDTIRQKRNRNSCICGHDTCVFYAERRNRCDEHFRKLSG